jgi:CelD/BcsL family acetyltransferase involved in cellulose biosynthesis
VSHVLTASLRDEWDDLADRTNAPIWMRPGWTEAWYRAFGAGTPTVATVENGGRIAALVPLERRRAELRTAANGHTPGVSLIADGTEAADALTRDVVRRGARLVTLWPIDRAGAERLKIAARGGGFEVVERIVERPPFIALDVGWEAYERTLGAKLRSECRRRMRRLEESGSVTFDIHDGSDGLTELLDEAFEIEAAGWKGRNGTAISSRPEVERFYREVAAWAAARGWLRVAFLRLDGRSLAFDLSFEDERGHYLLKTSFHPSAAPYAPGVLLRYSMIRRSFDLGLPTYEFLGHNDPWKLRWTKDQHDLILMKVFAPSLPGRAHRTLYQMGRSAKLAIQKRRG